MKEYNVLINNSQVRILLNKKEKKRNKLVIKFSNSINLLSNIVSKILEKRIYNKIQLMVKFEDMMNMDLIGHKNILQNINTKEYNAIYNFEPINNYRENEYVKFYELIRNE
ncbi:hypothetical protein SLOPH_622 [Spraguea lophii 42_110]|uniref:Uncharacterized protein n=1 Tax=Spraguea lophii (strain 42_110) TaxID=1358809 RepID=S7W528_SPRLO|nr:hypothetical protein SLOPH_622 [Spraguea lophii 42_110]